MLQPGHATERQKSNSPFQGKFIWRLTTQGPTELKGKDKPQEKEGNQRKQFHINIRRHRYTAVTPGEKHPFLSDSTVCFSLFTIMKADRG